MAVAAPYGLQGSFKLQSGSTVDAAEGVPPGFATDDFPLCDASDADPWIRAFRDRVTSYHGLARFAADHYGEVRRCHGRVTAEFDGAKFGTLILDFNEGVTLEVQTLPPEASISTLRAPSGFRGGSRARYALEKYAADIGLEIDWTALEITREEGAVEHTFWDPEAGLNASASLIYRSGRLVGVRISMAL